MCELTVWISTMNSTAAGRHWWYFPVLSGPSRRRVVPQLATTRRVIAVELQGHEHTVDIDRPLSYEAMADDVAALISSLGLERADLFGYSLGGGVALQTAIRHVASDYGWTAGVATLKTPSLILAGDADGVRLAHVMEFSALLGSDQGDGDLSGLPLSSLASQYYLLPHMLAGRLLFMGS